MAKAKTKLSSVEIAKRQRHLFLLRKVQENKTLSKVELDELRRYERGVKLTTTAGTRRQIKQVVSRTMKKSLKKKKASGKAGKKRRSRLPMREAKVRWLALECENLTEANATIMTHKSLADILKKHPRLKEAWDRGRFLREVRDVASQSPSISQAAKQLGFTERAFQEMLGQDEEVKDIWHQQQQLYVTVKGRIFDLAEEGNPWAIKILDDFLQANAGLKANVLEVSVTTNQLAELTGKSIRTIHNWRTKCGLPRNIDKTFDLRIFVLWYEGFLLKKASRENASISPLDPLRAAKAEMIKLELAKRRKQLLDRQEVVVGLVQRIQHLKNFCARGAEELSWRCQNQPRKKIKETFDVWFREMYLSFTKLPTCLELPPKMGEELVDFLKRLKPQGDSG